MQDLQTQLIGELSRRSNRYGDKLVAFLEAYNLMGLREATAEQLAEYIEKSQAFGKTKEEVHEIH